jgi:dTDP-4-dehydrorhamnose 3,5-epimerase
MEFSPTSLPGVMLIQPLVHGDHRGFFMESWNRTTFARAGIDVGFVQDNHSRSVRGTLRGLHYQIRQPQGKLVRVIAGEIYDVAVDIRKSSATFGKWTGATLSADNKLMLWVPPGFAHGYFVASPVAEVIYKCTDAYAPEQERTILWNDPDLAIDWPIPEGGAPLLSQKDERGTRFRAAEVFP